MAMPTQCIDAVVAFMVLVVIVVRVRVVVRFIPPYVFVLFLGVMEEMESNFFCVKKRDGESLIFLEP